MNRLYFYQDFDELSFIKFYEDGRAMFFGKNTRFDQHLTTFDGVKIESDKVDYLYGHYWIGEGNRIKIRLEGEYRLDYRGFIKNETILELVCRCQYTNFRKVVTFKRFSEREHLVHFKMQKRL